MYDVSDIASPIHMKAERSTCAQNESETTMRIFGSLKIMCNFRDGLYYSCG